MSGEGAADHAQAALVAALAARQPAPVLIETHISRVLLVDALAYKFKRPVQLPFVDYGTLPARLHFCEEELRLNQRLAPALYLGVSHITGTPEAPTLDGPGPRLDVAVRMRRFAAGALWSERLAAGTLRAQHVDRLAARLAAFHTAAARAPEGGRFGSATERGQAALDACTALAGRVPESERSALQAWLQASAAALQPLWQQRKHAGFVRECHGDLHLHNLLVIDDDAFAFDGIEFNEALRWIDVIDDIAFAVMDLAAHGRPDYAMRLLDGWLEPTGDHAALPALRFALVYRALVRAEVAALQDRPAALQRYFAAAQAWAAGASPRLLITHGLPGSGKSFVSSRLLEATGAIRLRSDVERKRLAGLPAMADSRALGVDLYGADSTARTYAELLARARIALTAGWPTIIDAAFLRRRERDAAAALARELGVSFTILDCRAAPALLQARIAARRAQRRDASEADLAVLAQLQRVQEPLGTDELARALVYDGSHESDATALAAAWRGTTFTTP